MQRSVIKLNCIEIIGVTESGGNKISMLVPRIYGIYHNSMSNILQNGSFSNGYSCMERVTDGAFVFVALIEISASAGGQNHS